MSRKTRDLYWSIGTGGLAVVFLLAKLPGPAAFCAVASARYAWSAT